MPIINMELNRVWQRGISVTEEIAKQYNFSDWIWAIPILHISSTIINLWSYGVGFGGTFLSLISAVDVGVSAVTAMPYIYFSVGVSFFCSILIPYNKLINIRKENEAKAERFSLIMIVIITILLPIPILIEWVSSNDGYGRPYREEFAAPFWIWFTFMIPALAVNLRFRPPATFVLSIMVISLTLSGSAFVGFSSGHTARYARYADPEIHRAKCKKHEILRTVGDGYLVVTSDHTKQIVNKNCETSITLPSPQWWTENLKRESIRQRAIDLAKRRRRDLQPKNQPMLPSQ